MQPLATPQQTPEELRLEQDFRSAVAAREAAHTAIVQGFRQLAQGRGDGPSEVQLQAFAQVAAHEQRLLSRRVSALVQRVGKPARGAGAEEARRVPRATAPPARGVVFAGLGELVSLWLGGHAPGVEVCAACQTVNRATAWHCKACERRLPAYFAALHAGSVARAEPHPPSAPSHRRAGMTGLASAAASVVLAVMAGLWFAPALRAPADLAAPVAEVAAGPAVGVSARAVPVSGLGAPDAPAQSALAPLAPVVLAASREVLPAVPLLQPEAPSAPDAAQAAPQAPITNRVARRSPPGASRSATGTSRITPAMRVAASRAIDRCESMNFVARAVCLNNRCADALIGQSPRCTEPRRQRLADEARRNPLLVG